MMTYSGRMQAGLNLRLVLAMRLGKFLHICHHFVVALWLKVAFRVLGADR